jgi:hypothetical protein
VALLMESEFVSRYTRRTVGLLIHKDGEPGDADGNAVMVRMEGAVASEGAPAVVIFERAAQSVDTGVYEVTISSVEASTPGLYTLVWSFTIDGTQEMSQSWVEVGEASPSYDALTPEFRDTVESVWIRFADLFDSPNGGPHLQTYFQSHFGRGRLAQLLTTAVKSVNAAGQPYTNFGLVAVGGIKVFPIETWGGFLETALYIEALKHLIRSYTEQPDAVGVDAARLDRKDYMDRWMRVLELERRDFERTTEVFKMAHMGLGRPRVLVSGGAYGNFSGRHRAGGNAAAARPRYHSSFF